MKPVISLKDYLEKWNIPLLRSDRYKSSSEEDSKMRFYGSQPLLPDTNYKVQTSDY